MDNITIHPLLLQALLHQQKASGFFQNLRLDRDQLQSGDPKEGFKEYDELYRKAQDLAERIKAGDFKESEIEEISNAFQHLNDKYDMENDFFYWPNNTK